MSPAASPRQQGHCSPPPPRQESGPPANRGRPPHSLPPSSHITSIGSLGMGFRRFEALRGFESTFN
eukprot:6057860-Alexandrium_andersonii.AAC.1